jgi:radical SAM protein with 4Fe4S-binding SPASM domain
MEVKVFDFARLVPQGRGRGVEMLDARGYREVLLRVLDTYDRLEKAGTRTIFGRKEALWNLLYSELDLFRPGPWDGLVHSGCGAGSKVLTVLADGTVYPCRRLPLEVGRVPRDDFGDIFFRARTQIELRDVSRFEKCRDCRLLAFCRGCPGVALGATGDPFAPDPQCWKDGPDDLTKVDMARIRKGFVLKDHGIWSGKATRQCATCDGVCGGCASVCGGCSEVCASCGGGPDA